MYTSNKLQRILWLPLTSLDTPDQNYYEQITNTRLPVNKCTTNVSILASVASPNAIIIYAEHITNYISGMP